MYMYTCIPWVYIHCTKYKHVIIGHYMKLDPRAKEEKKKFFTNVCQ